MLDKSTKTIINNARDVLVGKVPNPQSQVDLITIAMIYKFMDDMDMQNIELGGNRVFFTDDLETYAWRNLLAAKYNNWDRLSLYSEALDKLQIAKQIPELFRKIFKGAFLPFRDGATLTLFLKEIDQLTYDNSENLGNAFEYLLSVMGSQGDAGQFRTPRHIIDFIVEVVNPSKTDTILDPACGTAGFLISAYKHILAKAKETNTPLTPEQMKKLTGNIVGYDISPDMVKLASVNLFLHQFAQPKIYEYDTLTSEERWSDKFDVILANPPFMTPKGGIQPHSKFGVKANRAEVLFVDYMMEHLNIRGKAGFVVPEGIIFQSATAYKSLRKMMIEDDYLYAVVSLPSGVFNPYSGVKTSILFFDRELAKQTKDILFIKIDNDGYDLGAQRRQIKDNDLPEAIELLKLWQKSITSGTIDEKISKSKRVTIVSKEKLAEDGEYNLSASRYQETQDFSNCQYDMVKLIEQLENVKYTNKIQKSEFLEKGLYPIVDQSEDYIAGYWNNPEDIFKVTKPVVIFGDHTRNIKYVDFDFVLGADGVKILLPNDKWNTRFFYYLLKSIDIRNLGYSRHFKELKDKEIPLPPISVQEEIVKELDAYQAIIEGAQKVVDNWKPTFKINPNWEKVKLDDIFIEIKNGKNVEQLDSDGKYKVSRIQTISDGTVNLSKVKYTNDDVSEKDFFQKGDILLSHINSFEHLAKSAIFNYDEKVVHGVNLIRFSPDKTKIVPEYMAYYFKKNEFIDKARSFAQRAVNQASIKTSDLKNIEVYIPSLEEQKVIVAQIEQEEQYVEACKKLIELNKQKISNKIKSIWNCDED
ncbi:MAG: N-6 DNA methylase [Alphaproteobacteria bacterium]|nr:N-6 DNA methylase [Alphaproteobacteria bacterium]